VLLEQLQADEKLNGIPRAKEGLAEMSTLFRLLNAYGVLNKVCNVGSFQMQPHIDL
jgi:hypothetical protein